MNQGGRYNPAGNWPRLSQFPAPAKALVTATIGVMGIALFGALAQILVHDIIPTFFSGKTVSAHVGAAPAAGVRFQGAGQGEPEAGRGDLFSDLGPEDTDAPAHPLYKRERFVWLLKWSHIHLFGMNMIFIFMGAVAVFLDIGRRQRTWLVMMPFAGVLLDISAMWLKAYLSPVFFWLHIPGGGLFGSAYLIVSIRAMAEMWGQPAGGPTSEMRFSQGAEHGGRGVAERSRHGDV